MGKGKACAGSCQSSRRGKKSGEDIKKAQSAKWLVRSPTPGGGF